MIDHNKIESLINIPRMGFGTRAAGENVSRGLYDLISSNNLFEKDIIEIGCFLGISTELFAVCCKNITSIDLWGTDLSYDGGECPRDYWPSVEAAARNRLLEYPNALLVKDSSTNYSKMIEDESKDGVYIDGDHSYVGVLKDLFIWYPKIKKGGIISGHDYNQEGVVKAVTEFIDIQKCSNFKVFSDTSWSMIK